MSRFQATLWQLDNYGPWTTTPNPRPEMQLQSLQSRLYADLAECVGERGGYVFRTREDNVVAITNGIDREAHAAIQERLGDRYPVTVSAGIGVGETPVSALGDATDALQRAGSAQQADRRSVLRGETLDHAHTFHVAHFDVVDATAELTDAVDADAAFATMESVVTTLRSYLRTEHDSLAFFVGGDNAIAVTPPLPAESYRAACRAVTEGTAVSLRVGVGCGETATAAGMDAKHALEEAREREQPVVVPPAVAAD